MSVDYQIVVKGNNLRLGEGFLGLANLTLIHTQAGPMLFDLGHAVNREALVNGLARVGLKPSDIPRIFLSHLHYDHVNNIDLFPFNTEVYVSRAEWEYAASPHEEDPWVPWMIREQLEKYKVNFLEGSGEFQAGIRYIPAPGHTPGSYALVLDTEDKGRVVIAGDALKFAKEALKCKCDHAFDSPEKGTETIKHLLSLGDRIVPGHFSELIRQGGTYVWDEPCELHLVVR
jgi:glyoxylase-like metal-dependent hydrolase (beta-lactamase superfamily II)